MRCRSCSISASVVAALRKLIRLTARTVPVASTITLAIITHRVTVIPKKIHSGLVTPLEFSSVAPARRSEAVIRRNRLAVVF